MPHNQDETENKLLTLKEIKKQNSIINKKENAII